MVLKKDLVLVTLGSGSLLGLVGTSGYFIYKKEYSKSIERDISNTLGEINTEVQKLIGKKVNDSGDILDVKNWVTISNLSDEVSWNETALKTNNPEIQKKIEDIEAKITSAESKNSSSWKYYFGGIGEIIKKYKEIVEKERTSSVSRFTNSSRYSNDRSLSKRSVSVGSKDTENKKLKFLKPEQVSHKSKTTSIKPSKPKAAKPKAAKPKAAKPKAAKPKAVSKKSST